MQGPSPPFIDRVSFIEAIVLAAMNGGAGHKGRHCQALLISANDSSLSSINLPPEDYGGRGWVNGEEFQGNKEPAAQGTP